jgi:adenylosuccinate synthase
MKADVLLGLQWGDEGKGKVVDVLTPKYDVIARFQGGPNAGHTLEFNGIKHVLHMIPSGIFRPEAINVIGNGVVIDPVIFKKEIEALQSRGVDVHKTLILSERAHLILPTHRLIDAASEASKGKNKIGSTLKGIGPTYMDKTGRNGLRIGDIEMPDFREKYNTLVQKHFQILKFHEYDYNLAELEPAWFEGIELIRSFRRTNTEYLLNQYLNEGKSILAEGAQGSLLDIEFGTYPYVTSSNTLCAGACTGLGLAPSKIGNVYGIVKAYSTRVGGGPFPTELLNETGEILRKAGNEFGSTTGRPRRCGWLDLPSLRHSIMLSGVTEIIMTKADVLSVLDQINICTHYKYKGKAVEFLPYDINENTIEPVYKEFKSWKQDLSKLHSADEIPVELDKYIQFMERELKISITFVSVGPDRSQILNRTAFAHQTS